jgi:hypothetical protein
MSSWKVVFKVRKNFVEIPFTFVIPKRRQLGLSLIQKR